MPPTKCLRYVRRLMKRKGRVTRLHLTRHESKKQKTDVKKWTWDHGRKCSARSQAGGVDRVDEELQPVPYRCDT